MQKPNSTSDRIIWRLLGIIGIPHELLHVLGYYLVGKSCKYQWGQPYVTPLGSMTIRERLVGLLLPFIISLLAWILLTIGNLAAMYYHLRYDISIFYPLFWGALTVMAAAYATLSIHDLKQAYHLLKKEVKPAEQLDHNLLPHTDKHTSKGDNPK